MHRYINAECLTIGHIRQSGFVYTDEPTLTDPMLLGFLTVDFGEVKTAPTECKVKCFLMMSSAYFYYSKVPQNMLMLMIHLRKRSC